jgi:hypothetical protein
MAPDESLSDPTPKKPSLPVSTGLRAYLRRYRRERALPITYERLRRFSEAAPLVDASGKTTLWESVVYDRLDMESLNEDLKQVYASIRVDGDLSVMRHLYVDRVDFCAFGNSAPFRIRIVNAFNDNADYYYVKRADASRVYGLELEHLLSPNRLNYLTCGSTLVEEHIAGLPGDVFINRWLDNPELRPIRIAKELVKFNERCFVRLLGDMRSYNFVVVVTPDFESAQVRIRAMDFDQQSYEGRMNFYRPQFFKDKRAARRLLHEPPAHADRAAIPARGADAHPPARRARVAPPRRAARGDGARPPSRPRRNCTRCARASPSITQRAEYLQCDSMGALVRENLATLRHVITRARGSLDRARRGGVTRNFFRTRVEKLFRARFFAENNF